jgi:hypothetical protein
MRLHDNMIPKRQQRKLARRLSLADSDVYALPQTVQETINRMLKAPDGDASSYDFERRDSVIVMKAYLPDHSEFPSLSGSAQQQAQQQAQAQAQQQVQQAQQQQQLNTPPQAIWGSSNNGVRAQPSTTTTTTTTRSSNTPASTPQAIRPPSQLSTQTRQSDDQGENGLNPFPSLGAGSEDFSFGQTPASQMARQHQAQQGLTEEFPPLGGLGVGTIGHQQRSRLGQDPMTNPDAVGTSSGPSRTSADTPSQFSNDRKTSSQDTSSRGELGLGLIPLPLC